MFSNCCQLLNLYWAFQCFLLVPLWTVSGTKVSSQSPKTDMFVPESGLGICWNTWSTFWYFLRNRLTQLNCIPLNKFLQGLCVRDEECLRASLQIFRQYTSHSYNCSCHSTLWVYEIAKEMLKEMLDRNHSELKSLFYSEIWSQGELSNHQAWISSIMFLTLSQ